MAQGEHNLRDGILVGLKEIRGYSQGASRVGSYN